MNYQEWLLHFIECGAVEPHQLQLSLLAVLSQHREGLDVVVPEPERLAAKYEVSLMELMEGLMMAQEKQWLDRMAWQADDRAIRVTLALPEQAVRRFREAAYPPPPEPSSC